jgi:hypothetical protein
MEKSEIDLSKVRRESIIKLIDSTFKVLNVDELNDETIAYGIRNYIAKYSLAKNTHLVSEKAYNQIKSDKILRSHKKKFNVKFEHVVPSKVIFDHLIKLKADGEYNSSKLRELLELTDIVTIITKEENDLLDTKGSNECLRSKMVDDNIISEETLFSRYEKVGIELLKDSDELDGYHKINMGGAIYR